jgi:membrane-associated phospholipid phosphatase
VIGEGIRTDSRRILWLATVASLAIFLTLTVLVATGSTGHLDASAFDVADDVRAPWLDHAARIVTTLGLIAIVGPAVALGAVILILRARTADGAALLVGALLTWAGVWIVKAAVGRARPPDPLVHTTGESFPSAHAANAVGWLALALALSALIRTRTGRVAATAAGFALAAMVGLSRVYLRAHYLSDVIAGEALGVAMYALVAIGALTWLPSRRASGSRPANAAERHPGARRT